VKQFIQYIQYSLKHKIPFLRFQNLKSKLIKYGPTFLIILIIVEIIKHFGLPLFFLYLGNNVHDFFYVLIPAPLLMCLHIFTAPLIFIIYIKIIKKKFKLSEFYLNTLKLVASISIAQLIPIFITPILTQFFSPEEFGIYGLYLSLCTIFGVIASGKFDTAIMLPKNKKDSLNLLFLSFLIAFTFSTIFFSFLNIFNDKIFQLLNLELLKEYYYIIPITIFLISVNQSFLVWFNREKKYNVISTNNIIKSGANSSISLFLGFKKIVFGLIIGNLVSLILICIFNIFFFLKEFKFEQIQSKIIKKNFIKYIDFLKFSSVSNLFNSIANLGMTTLIIIFFGPKIAGLYFLAEKLIAVPISFITTSISQVYFQRASELFYLDKKKLLHLTNKIQLNIFFILFPILIITSIYGKEIFLLFGNEWGQAGTILKYFTPILLLKNIYSPISHIGDILNKQKVLLLFNISLFIFQLASFYFLKEYSDIKFALLTASSISALHYMFLNNYMKKELTKLI
tara:strand:- start:14622 stop:16151 length:1530 start_codon:yes stop_codon:yes gene_type:complete